LLRDDPGSLFVTLSHVARLVVALVASVARTAQTVDSARGHTAERRPAGEGAVKVAPPSRESSFLSFLPRVRVNFRQ
jgi:hypothetical protein